MVAPSYYCCTAAQFQTGSGDFAVTLLFLSADRDAGQFKITQRVINRFLSARYSAWRNDRRRAGRGTRQQSFMPSNPQRYLTTAAKFVRGFTQRPPVFSPSLWLPAMPPEHRRLPPTAGRGLCYTAFTTSLLPPPGTANALVTARHHMPGLIAARSEKTLVMDATRAQSCRRAE